MSQVHTRARKWRVCKPRAQGNARSKAGVQRRRLWGGPEAAQKAAVRACEAECLDPAGEVQMGQAAKREVVPGVGEHTLLQGAGGAGGQGCLLPARWLAPRPRTGSGPPRSAGREQAGGPGKGAGCLPTRPQGCVCKGAGHARPANNSSSNRLPGRAPGHSLPPLSSHSLLPSTVLQLRIHRRYQDPSKCGPCTGGDGGPSPPGAPLECSCRVSWLVPEPQSLCPGDAETHPLGGPRSTGPLHPTPRSTLVSPLPGKRVHPEENAPGSTFGAHTSLRMWRSASLSPQGQEYWPHPCSSKPPNP